MTAPAIVAVAAVSLTATLIALLAVFAYLLRYEARPRWATITAGNGAQHNADLNTLTPRRLRALQRWAWANQATRGQPRVAWVADGLILPRPRERRSGRRRVTSSRAGPDDEAGDGEPEPERVAGRRRRSKRAP